MRYIPLLSLLLVLLACAQTKSHVDTEHNSMNALDWNGRYYGQLSCATCSGMDVNITLNSDLTFHMTVINLDKPEKVYHTEGTFIWNKNGSIIELSSTIDQVAKRYKVIEGGLVIVDDKDQVVSVQDSMLFKNDLTITGREWLLFEIQGKKLKFDKSSVQPNLVLDENGKVRGTTGCNQYHGDYTTSGGMTLRFGPMATTKMFCSELMDLETAFLEVFQQCDNYTISGDTLSLNKGKMAALAKFVQKQ